jgi:hypothetical protein
MDGKPVCPLRGPYEAVRRPSWKKNPVALYQEERLAVHLKFGRTVKQYDPLIMVLVIVDRPFNYPAEDLLNDHFAHLNKFLDVLTAHGRNGARKKPSTGGRAHRLKATPGIADLSLTETITARRPLPIILPSHGVIDEAGGKCCHDPLKPDNTFGRRFRAVLFMRAT